MRACSCFHLVSISISLSVDFVQYVMICSSQSPFKVIKAPGQTPPEEIQLHSTYIGTQIIRMPQTESTCKVSQRASSLLTDTLIPLIVLQVPLRTAAPVASNQVLTAVLTPVVVVTLIRICQEHTYTNTGVRTLFIQLI